MRISLSGEKQKIENEIRKDSLNGRRGPGGSRPFYARRPLGNWYQTVEEYGKGALKVCVCGGGGGGGG